MTTLSSGIDYVDLNFLGRPGIIATAILQSTAGVALDRSRAVDHARRAETQLAGQGHRARGHAADAADAHPPRSRRVRRRADGGVPARRAARPRARRAAHGRPVPADGQRHPALRRGHGAPVGGDAARGGCAASACCAGGERIDGRRPRRSRSATRPGMPRTTSATSTAGAGIAFVGDIAGIRRGQGNYILPPTPPPDIDLEAWRESADLILAWDPDTLFLTHFGPFHGARPHFQELFERLQGWSDLVRRLLADPSLDGGRSGRSGSSKRRSRNCGGGSARRKPANTAAPAGWTIPGRASRATGGRRASSRGCNRHGLTGRGQAESASERPCTASSNTWWAAGIASAA